MKKGFENRILGVPLPPRGRGESPAVSSIERAPGGWRLTRRDLMTLVAAGAFAGRPRPARAASGTGAYAHKLLIVSLAFSPDGQTLVSAGRDGFVKFWSLPNGGLFRTVATTQLPIQVAFSPDGSQVAVAMDNGALELYPAGGGTARALNGHTASVEGLAFTPDGGQLVSVSLDRTTRIWSVAGAALLQSFTDATDTMLRAAIPRTARQRAARDPGRNAAAPAPAQRYLVTSGQQTYVRSMATGAIMQTAAGKVFAASPDGRFLAAHDGTKLYMYAFPSLLLNTSLVNKQNAAAVAYSADGSLLSVAYLNAPAALYSAPDLTLKLQFGPATNACSAVAMDSQNQYLALASGRNILLYQLPSGAALPACFMDIADSAPTCSGIRYSYGGVVYTVGCGAALPDGAVCSCDCVPGDCSCVDDTGCACVGDSGCNCDTEGVCSCDSDTGCDCVGDIGCSCDSDYGCGCVDDTGCGCDGDSGGCGCDGDSGGGCGCDGEFA